MIGRAIILLALALCAVVFSAVSQDKPESDVIKVDTRLVSVPVIVSDRDGRYIPGLNQEDFTILQDGILQKIEFFASVEEPITVALLIDTSQSTQPVLADLKESAKSFVDLLGPRDRALILAFDYDLHLLGPLTSDHGRLNRSIRSARIGEFGGTQLRAAVFKTVTESFRGITGRKAIILLTDGKDANSQITADDLFNSLEEADTLVYPVMFKTGESGITYIIMPSQSRDTLGQPYPGGPQQPMLRLPSAGTLQNQKAESFLRKLSDTTAGRFFLSDDGKLKKTFESIVEELRFQYRLGYYPAEETGSPTVHEIKVKVAHPNLVVRARSSYRSGGRQSDSAPNN